MLAESAEKFMAAYEEASDVHDLNRVLSMIDKQAVYFFSDESVHMGKVAIEQVLRRNFELIQDESYSIENLTWLAKSDAVAACIYDYRWSGTVHGRESSGSGRGTSVLRRIGADWKVVHEHLSSGKYKD